MKRGIQVIGNALGVKPGEGWIFTLLLLANMLIGVARNFSWTAGNAIFLERFGSENQPYLFLLNSALMPTLAAIYMRVQQKHSFRTVSKFSFFYAFGFLSS